MFKRQRWVVTVFQTPGPPAGAIFKRIYWAFNRNGAILAAQNDPIFDRFWEWVDHAEPLNKLGGDQEEDAKREELRTAQSV